MIPLTAADAQLGGFIIGFVACLAGVGILSIARSAFAERRYEKVQHERAVSIVTESDAEKTARLQAAVAPFASSCERTPKTTQSSALGTTEGEEDGNKTGVHSGRTGQVAEGSDGRGLHGGSGVLDRSGSDSTGTRRVAAAPCVGEQISNAGFAPELTDGEDEYRDRDAIARTVGMRDSLAEARHIRDALNKLDRAAPPRLASVPDQGKPSGWS